MDKLVRYCPPTKLDIAPFGTIYHVIVDGDLPAHRYIQTSQDETIPQWERMGVFLEKVYEESLDDDQFINECLRLFIDNKKMQHLKIRELISHSPEN